MSDGTKNLMIARGDRSVWDEPGFAGTLAALDGERWLTVASATLLGTIGARRGGFSGALLGTAGVLLAVRAAMGCRDFSGARARVDQLLQQRGWRRPDIVTESSNESFPASDSPAWTTGSTGPAR